MVQSQHPPLKEYEARRDCLLAHAPTIEMQVIVDEDYGLRTFRSTSQATLTTAVPYCYQHRLEETAWYAAEHYEAFTSTLLASLYQDHDGIKAAAEKYARQYGVEFLYRDFRPNFRAGESAGQRTWLYMQKYCGCVFSEQDRYQQIDRDKKIHGAGISPPCFVAERSF